MVYSAINFKEKLATFSDRWSPKIVAQMNDYHFKLVKIQGDFVWHNHADADEVFIVLDGDVSIEFGDGKLTCEWGRCLSFRRVWSTNHSPKRNAVCCLLNRQGRPTRAMPEGL